MIHLRTVTSSDNITRRRVLWTALFLLLAVYPSHSEPPAQLKKACSGCESESLTATGMSQDPTRLEVFRLDGPGSVQVNNVMGDITFIDTDSDEVRVEMYVKRSFSFWGESRRDDHRVIIVQNNNDVTVNVEPPGGAGVGRAATKEISFVVFAPPYMEIVLKTGFGNIRAQGLGRTHDIRTAAGNILIERSSGEGRILTTAGNIEVSGYDGSLMCLSAGGNITLSEVKGSVKVKTRGGHIRADHIDGNLMAETAGGNIRAKMISVNEGLYLQTSAGDVTADLPAGAGFDVVMRGTQTKISDWSSFRGIRKNNEVDGEIKGGGTLVNLFTIVGTAEIVLTSSNP